MAGDWFKVHRKLKEHPIMQHDGLARLWLYCLIRANWRQTTWLIPGTTQAVTIPRGAFITGREALHRDLYPKRNKHTPSPSTTWRRLEDLERMNCLAIQNLNNRCSLVTICNYETYQDGVDDVCTTAAQPLNNCCTTDAQPMHTEEEEQEIKKEKKSKKNTGGAAEYSPDFLRFWDAFPSGRKTKKGEAYVAWKKAVKRADPEIIIAAAAEYADSEKGRGEFVSGPSPWLNNNCWEDDRAAWNPSIIRFRQRVATAADLENWNPTDGGFGGAM